MTKCKYETPFGMNPFKKKGKGVVEVTARLANAKTAEIFATIQVKGEAAREKVDVPQTPSTAVGSDDFKATVINEAIYDVANKLAAELERRSPYSKPQDASAASTASGTTPTPSREVKTSTAPPSSPDPKPQPSKPAETTAAQTPATQPPPKSDKVGLVSRVIGNTVLIALEQDGALKVGDKVKIKRIAKPIPDPYKPGANLGYEFTDIGFVLVGEIVGPRVVKGTFVAAPVRGPVKPLPRFQDWAVIAP